MNLDTLKNIVKVAKDDGVSELKVETKEFKVEVRFGSTHVPQVISHGPIHHVTPAVSTQSSAQVNVAAKAVVKDDNSHVIKSPFVGTFYASPGPGKPVYVKIGDKVKVGQALCVLEAMKIMNEIDADINGEIIDILVENESLVEFGQPLFKIKPN
jgi:acetyl-CoA carboxylase biotin carboxyl carrier protein